MHSNVHIYTKFTFAPEGLLIGLVVSCKLAFSTIFSASLRVDGWQRTNTGG